MTRMFCIVYLLYWNALLMVILQMLKKEAGDVPFNVGQERTIPEKLCLCSWMEIYPLFSRFVSYGVLKGRFQLLDRPILLMDLNDMIASRVSTCCVLHNILLVADRIMDGDYRARYDPAASVVLEEQ